MHFKRILKFSLLLLVIVLSLVSGNYFILGWVLILGLILIIDEFKKEELVSEERSLEEIKPDFSVFDRLPYGVIVVLEDQSIIYTNRSFKNIVNQELKSIDEDFSIFIKQVIVKKMLDRNPGEILINSNGKDYKVIFINLKVGGLFVFEDITILIEKERQQKRFLADASHELKTPITVIKGMSEILNQVDFSDEAVRADFITQIYQESLRLENIVNDLTLQSKLGTQQFFLTKEEFNLSSFFKELGSRHDKDLKESQITFKVNLDETIKVYAERNKLLQVFDNLTLNAINHAPQGMIEIKAKKTKDGVKISFKDNGSGIDEENITNIFERFYRGDKSRDRHTGGSGLGLAISKAIIEAHGGSMEVKSQVNQYTEFLIFLTKN